MLKAQNIEGEKHMTKGETIINNVMKIMNSTEAGELNDFDIYDYLVEDNEIYVGGKSFFPKSVIETISNPLILMMEILVPNLKTVIPKRGIRIIVMSKGEIKMNIMSVANTNIPSVIKTFKDEENWQADLEMLAWYLTEQKPKEDAGEFDYYDDDLLF